MGSDLSMMQRAIFVWPDLSGKAVSSHTRCGGGGISGGRGGGGGGGRTPE